MKGAAPFIETERFLIFVGNEIIIDEPGLSENKKSLFPGSFQAKM